MYWIASYPKSGNTWMRIILTYLLFDKELKDKDTYPFKELIASSIPDLTYQYKNETRKVKSNIGYLSLLKTHRYEIPFQENEEIETVGFVYLYRHPLDVFLSAMNYKFIKNDSQFFNGGKPKSVDDLKASDELNYYVDKFINNDLKLEIWGKNSKTYLDHIEYWLNVSTVSNENKIIIRYEDLLENTFQEIIKFKSLFEITDNEIKKAIAYANKQTSDGNRFFWRKQSKNYQKYIDKKYVDKFNEKYRETLEILGY